MFWNSILAKDSAVASTVKTMLPFIPAGSKLTVTTIWLSLLLIDWITSRTDS
ncbi:MAG: hypothetical protein BWY98_00668 [Tenericutes bacterium ADurb.BinA155]|nr:MAG: hypothetical protein BWY98_00668 [Tenericutes bacterium ADurb.BinA155]